MSVIFVVLTIILFIGTETLLQYLRRRKLVKVSSSVKRQVSSAPVIPDFLKNLVEPEGIFYNPGHTWAFLEMDGTVKIGLDSFFHQIMGKVDRIEVPEVGDETYQGSLTIIVQKGERKIYVPVPIDGTVEAVNKEALKNPEILLKDPYNTGWLLLMKPHNFMESVQTLKFGKEAKKWFAREVHRLRDFLVEHFQSGDVAFQTMYDGGIPVFGVSGMLSDDSWESLKQEFFTTGEMVSITR